MSHFPFFSELNLPLVHQAVQVPVHQAVRTQVHLQAVQRVQKQ